MFLPIQKCTQNHGKCHELEKLKGQLRARSVFGICGSSEA